MEGTTVTKYVVAPSDAIEPSPSARLSSDGPAPRQDARQASDASETAPRLSAPEIMARTRARLARMKNQTSAGASAAAPRTLYHETPTSSNAGNITFSGDRVTTD